MCVAGKVLNQGVRARKEQPFVSVLVPPHEPGRTAVLTVNLQDLGVAVVVADVVSLDDQTVANGCTHCSLLRSL
jgi:hypothetical protein